jgi:hypothetical protein
VVSATDPTAVYIESPLLLQPFIGPLYESWDRLCGLDFLAAYSEVPGSIPGTARISE